MERACCIDAQTLGHLRHVQPLLFAPLLAQVGDELGVGDSGQAYHITSIDATPGPAQRTHDLSEWDTPIAHGDQGAVFEWCPVSPRHVGLPTCERSWA